MSFFEKIGKALIEEVPTENETVVISTEESISIPEDEIKVEVELNDVNTDTLIEDIYTQNDLYDKSKSIFKVEELINTLPKEMVTEAKRTSIISALGIFGLTATQTMEDGEARVTVLKGVKEKINNDANDSISARLAKIEELKQNIADLEKEITSQKSEMKLSNDSIDAEISRINELIKFLGGTN